jgi:hypothetical protein
VTTQNLKLQQNQKFNGFEIVNMENSPTFENKKEKDIEDVLKIKHLLEKKK